MFDLESKNNITDKVSEISDVNHRNDSLNTEDERLSLVNKTDEELVLNINHDLMNNPDVSIDEEIEAPEDELGSDETPVKKSPTTSYDKRKTIAHGMMDTALISANANQLKFILLYYREQQTRFYILIFLVVFSLFIQVAVGIALIFRQKKKNKNKSVDNEENDNNFWKVMTVDEFIILGVFLIIIINIFISTFSGDGPVKTD